MKLKVLPAHSSLSTFQIATIALVCCALFGNNIANLVIPNNQTIEFLSSVSGDRTTSSTMRLLYFGMLATCLLVVLSLVANPSKWIVAIAFCIAVFAIGNTTQSTLNIIWDQSPPKLIVGDLVGISKDTKYGKTLWATVQNSSNQSVRIATQYDLRRNLVEIRDTKVSFYLCAGYFAKPYICSSARK